MNGRTRIFVNLLLLSVASAAMAQKPSNTIDLSVTFSEMHANAPVGGCGCFWMAGGMGEFSFPLWRNFSAVIAAGGQHTDHIPNFNTGLSLTTAMGGLRMRVPNHTRFQPFGQGLFGGVHGSTATSRRPWASCRPAMTHPLPWPSAAVWMSPYQDMSGYGLWRLTITIPSYAMFRAIVKTNFV
jgi:hypothetical protein